jgi:hypothetical protein
MRNKMLITNEWYKVVFKRIQFSITIYLKDDGDGGHRGGNKMKQIPSLQKKP